MCLSSSVADSSHNIETPFYTRQNSEVREGKDGNSKGFLFSRACRSPAPLIPPLKKTTMERQQMSIISYAYKGVIITALQS